jgi:hypothetical protein
VFDQGALSRPRRIRAARHVERGRAAAQLRLDDSLQRDLLPQRGPPRPGQVDPPLPVRRTRLDVGHPRHLDVQARAVGEVPVERLAGHTGSLGDRAHRHRRVGRRLEQIAWQAGVVDE